MDLLVIIQVVIIVRHLVVIIIVVVIEKRMPDEHVQVVIKLVVNRREMGKVWENLTLEDPSYVLVTL